MEEIKLIHTGSLLVSFIHPVFDKKLVLELSKKKITTISMDLVPRISRAQNIDALTSMANIAGYRAVIEAAYEFKRCLSG